MKRLSEMFLDRVGLLECMYKLRENVQIQASDKICFGSTFNQIFTLFAGIYYHGKTVLKKYVCSFI